MRILAIADEPSSRLWGDYCRESLSGVDLILSAGDLPAKYLSFLTCFTNAPVVYVHGNHDDRYQQDPPEGCLSAEGKIILVKGIRILGLGGSFRYRPDGVHMYTEKEMASRIASLRRKIRAAGGFDILLTHSPIRGLGDQAFVVGSPAFDIVAGIDFRQLFRGDGFIRVPHALQRVAQGEDRTG